MSYSASYRNRTDVYAEPVCMATVAYYLDQFELDIILDLPAHLDPHQLVRRLVTRHRDRALIELQVIDNHRQNAFDLRLVQRVLPSCLTERVDDADGLTFRIAKQPPTVFVQDLPIGGDLRPDEFLGERLTPKRLALLCSNCVTCRVVVGCNPVSVQRMWRAGVSYRVGTHRRHLQQTLMDQAGELKPALDT